MQRALPLLSSSEGAAGLRVTSVTLVWNKLSLCQHLAPNFGHCGQRQVASCWRCASPAFAPWQLSWGPLSWLSPSHCSWAATHGNRPWKSWLWGLPAAPDCRKVGQADMAQQQTKKVEAVKIGLKPKWKQEVLLLSLLSFRLRLLVLEPHSLISIRHQGLSNGLSFHD